MTCVALTTRLYSCGRKSWYCQCNQLAKEQLYNYTRINLQLQIIPVATWHLPNGFSDSGREASPCRNWRVLVTSAPCVEQRVRSRTLYRYGAYVETWRDFVLDVLHIRSIMTNAQEETTADEVRKNTLRSGLYGQHLWCH